MKKFNDLYSTYKEIEALPEKRKAELEKELQEAREADRAAQAAFTDAENDGKDSSELYTAWEAAMNKLKLTEARYKAVDVSKIGQALPKAAQDLFNETNSLIARKEKEKAKALKELADLQGQVLETFNRFADLQDEQITAQSIMTNEIAKKFKDLYVGTNWAIRAEELPLPTIEYLKKKRAEARNRGVEA